MEMNKEFAYFILTLGCKYILAQYLHLSDSIYLKGIFLGLI